MKANNLNYYICVFFIIYNIINEVNSAFNTNYNQRFPANGQQDSISGQRIGKAAPF